MDTGAEGLFHFAYERILSGVGDEGSVMQRKCAFGSDISARIEACHQFHAEWVLRGKTRRETASLVKAEK